MLKIIRGRYLAILIAMLLLFTGCSAEEILTEVPGTMQVAIESSAEANAEEEGTVSSAQEAIQKQSDSIQGSILSQGAESINQDVQDTLLEETSDYAYQSLSAEEQIWYRDIENALGSMAEKVRLSDEGLDLGLNENCIDKIFQCVLSDHPEIFYVDGYTYTKYSRGDKTVSIAFSGSYELSVEEALARKNQITQVVQPILAGVDANAGEYDKVKYVFETIIRNTEYDLNAPDNQNIYSVFAGGASVCQGYAKATQYLLNHLGVECTLVQGMVDNGEGHAWNLVRVDGSYYYVDTTWGDASYRLEEGAAIDPQHLPEINYDYLCVTTEQLLRTHTLESIVPMPECVDTAANYYVRQGALFTSYDKTQMEQLFAQNMANGSLDVTVKCADAECYHTIKCALIDNQEIFDYLPDGELTVSYAHNDKQLSLTFWVTNQ